MWGMDGKYFSDNRFAPQVDKPEGANVSDRVDTVKAGGTYAEGCPRVSASSSRRHLRLAEPAVISPGTMANHHIDIISDFDRAAEELPDEVRRPLDERQRDVAAARERAQVNEALLRMHVRSTSGSAVVRALPGRVSRLVTRLTRFPRS